MSAQDAAASSPRYAGTHTCPHCDETNTGFLRDVTGDGLVCSSCSRVF